MIDTYHKKTSELADRSAQDVLSRMKDLASYPPITISFDEAFAQLTSSWEIHIHVDSDFPRKYGAKLKALGGEYSACRGYQEKRFLHSPNTPAARKLLNIIMAECHGPDTCTIIARGTIAGPSNASWGQRVSSTVQFCNRLEDAEEKIRRALARDVKRGSVLLSWPDPRSTIV